MAPRDEATGPLERFEGGWITQELFSLVANGRWGGAFLLHWPLTLQHRYSGLSTDPGGGWILVQVITSRVIAGSALVGPTIVQQETRDTQRAHGIDAVCRADGHSPLTGAVPQLPERISSVDLGVPPLDFRDGVSHHVTVQLKGVTRELSLRERGFHKARWWHAPRKKKKEENRCRMEKQEKKKIN